MTNDRSRVTLARIIISVAVAVIAYFALRANHLQQTSALFVGIPALAAIAVVFGVSPKTATGVACKAVTIALLISLLFLWEGVLCVLMSAPLFFLIAILVARFVQFVREPERDRIITLRSYAFLLALVPMSLEGVTGLTTIDRDESVTVSRVVDAPSGAVAGALLAPPRFDRALPLVLRGGFPAPLASRIERDASGTRWVIEMRGGEMFLNGMEPRTGDLTLQLAESRPGVVRWRALSDTSHMTHFLAWRDIVVRYEAVDGNRTRVTWTIRYERGLDPAWYFGPMERFAVRWAADYLIDAVATP